jgi:hypothetical protein
VAQIIPVRVLADARPVLASERRFAAHRGHPLDSQPCPVCTGPLGALVTVLILAGIGPSSRKDSGWTTGAAVAVHADCAGVPEDEPAVPEERRAGFTSQWRRAPDCGRCGDRGRFRENNVEAHCTCKRGRRMSELWYADKHGYAHPDEPDPEPPYDDDGAPF